ncbi:TonB-dependent receptor [Roseiterribacter gracilis]|uniref:TonB-dependent receptor n=1 Tax=Roseiterribacter gracilis TaxID=2812848 RepID=A0A8S8XIK5_9PROT|nr:TonB-dependent receptor [Rhodospirillales bacterium TMPK1]
MNRRTRHAALAGTILSIGCIESVAAQTAPALEEVVVTASRRAERAIDVPVAVSSLSGEKLDVLNSSGQDIRFLSARTPSFLAESSFGRTFPRFYIRGLGNTDFDVNAAQPVSMVYDEVVLENPVLKSFPVFDLASVEVLRGPQGTLFGRNTNAGVIVLNSAKPGDTFSGYGSVSIGTDTTINTEGAVGGPISPYLKFRASFIQQHRDDYVDNTNAATKYRRKLEGYDDSAGRVQLEFTKDNFNALLNIHGRELDGTARLFRANILKKGSNDFVDGFDIDKVAQDGDNKQTLNSYGVGLRMSYKFAGATLHSVTGYERSNTFSRGDIDGGFGASFAPPFGPGFIPFPVETSTGAVPREFSQELRLAFDPIGKFRFQVGAYYFHQDLYISELSYDFGGKITDVVAHKDENETKALFGSVEYQATDQLNLRAGVRVSSDDKTNVTDRQVNSVGLGRLNRTTNVNDDKPSWDVSATYKLGPEVNLFARVSNGYLGPAIQDRVGFGNTISTAKSQVTTSYEAGIKTALFNNKAHLDLTGYYALTRNIQLTAVGGADNSARLLNADKAIGYGFEVEFEAAPAEHLTFTTGLSYNHTEIQSPGLSIDPCGGGCTVTDPLNAAGRALINGNPLPQAPQWIWNVTARYAVPVGASGEIFGYTDWAYRSEVNFFLYEAKEFKGKSLIEGGLRLGYKSYTGNWEAALFVRNILDQIRPVSAIDFNNLTAMVNEPRLVGAQFRINF